MNGCELHHDDPQAIAGNGRQDDGCQDQTGAVAPGGIREHLAMITSAGEMGKQLPDLQMDVEFDSSTTIYDCLVIPLHLKLSGFLSYRDPVELDFSGFDLACISGSNGAGKSSLLDAMTWALFGQARKRDEAVINLQSKAAEVAFTFAYETNVYRVIRSLARGKTTTLEFQIQQAR